MAHCLFTLGLLGPAGGEDDSGCNAAPHVQRTQGGGAGEGLLGGGLGG